MYKKYKMNQGYNQIKPQTPKIQSESPNKKDRNKVKVNYRENLID